MTENENTSINPIINNSTTTTSDSITTLPLASSSLTTIQQNDNNNNNTNNDNNNPSTNNTSSELEEWRKKREEREKERKRREELLNKRKKEEDQEQQEEDETLNKNNIPTKKKKLLQEEIQKETLDYLTKKDSSFIQKNLEEKSLLKQNINLEKVKLNAFEKMKQKEAEILQEVIAQRTPLLKLPNQVMTNTNLNTNLNTTRSPKATDLLLENDNTNVDNTTITDNDNMEDHLEMNWNEPSFYKNLTTNEIQKIHQTFHIKVEGKNIPPPILTFEHFKFPKPIINYLKNKKNITYPTPIQIQGISCILKGRDVLGMAFTGSGKTLVFSLPLIMYVYMEELKMKLVRGEGPLGLIICPSRELAKQTFDLINELCNELFDVKLNNLLCIGGEVVTNQSSSRDNTLRDNYKMKGNNKGPFHICVATPGRLLGMLKDKQISIDMCRYICLDEADKLIDLGFENEIRSIFEYFKTPIFRQKVLFSATMPEKIQLFIKTFLINPIIIKVGKVGTTNINVEHHVEYVPEQEKMVHLLEVLQKTSPPVLIFSQNKTEVDTITEYLLLKGIEAISIHSSKTQKEREYAIECFKKGEKDVLVATDLISKGIDFPNIQHVINFDMPREIENYIHRIGRTGRSNKCGLATTFINRSSNQSSSEQVLLDLKYLLKEAKQKIPSILESIYDPYEGLNEKIECGYCQGRGHRITECPKYFKDKQMELQKSQQTMMNGDGSY
ncbi:hypothetical protein ABK040_010527 [Willaertia magna]